MRAVRTALKATTVGARTAASHVQYPTLQLNLLKAQMLKPFDEMLQPDARYAHMMAPDERGGWRRMTMADHHDLVSSVILSPNAPDGIRQMFDRALHAALYAWFDYELTALAELQAYAALEAALRGYFQQEDSSLWNLLERAISKQLFDATLGDIPLPVALTTLRNEAAHGSINFVTPGMALTMIGYCAELIGRLYPEELPAPA